MTGDDELAAAVADRPHWQLAGAVATYAPPGATAVVRVQRVRQPVRRERYVVSTIRDGRAVHVLPVHGAAEAVRWAERTLPA